MKASQKGVAVCIGMMALLHFGIGTNPALSLEIVDAVHHADKPFPEYMPLWREGWRWTDKHGQRVRYADYMSLGGYVQLYVRHRGSEPIRIDDVFVDDVSLQKGVGSEKPNPARKGKFASGLAFSTLPLMEIDRLVQAGEPVWWKVDPNPVPPGGMAEVTIRLRRMPQANTFKVGLKSGDTTLSDVVKIGQERSRIVGVNFAPTMDEAFVYVQHPEQSMLAPKRVLVDGEDRTESALVCYDPQLDTSLIVIRLAKPAREPEFHCFQAVDGNGSSATACIRAWEPIFRYGMWGIPKEGDTPDERARRYLTRLHNHNINTVMSHYGAEVRSFVRSDEGRDLCAALGIRIMDHSHGTFDDPLYYYLPDEPDAHDFGSKSIAAPEKRLGSLAQWVLGVGDELRRKDPDTLLLCNVDNTYKPEQWYMYAQLPDVICADPYYPEQLRSVYRFDPNSLAAYTKPTYVYAVGEIYRIAGAPKPMHLILHTCRFDMKEFPFRAPTPEEKRVEVYYALAAGAKGISYWWYTPSKGRYFGCGGRSPEMEALLTEIGLLGAEAGTAGQLLCRGCPVDLPMRQTRSLWARCLLAGPETVVVLLVNDKIACDQSGFRSVPIEKAQVSLTLPAWLSVNNVFEITSTGTHNVNWKAEKRKLHLDLGKVELTRFLVASADGTLRETIQSQYDQRFAANVAKITRRMGSEE
jgi:hypothetical protein